jgi:hypothetical protein
MAHKTILAFAAIAVLTIAGLAPAAARVRPCAAPTNTCVGVDLVKCTFQMEGPFCRKFCQTLLGACIK